MSFLSHRSYHVMHRNVNIPRIECTLVFNRQCRGLEDNSARQRQFSDGDVGPLLAHERYTRAVQHLQCIRSRWENSPVSTLP